MIGPRKDAPKSPPPDIPPHVRAAIVDDITEAAARVLSEEERDLVTIAFEDPDDGPPSVVIRGPGELVDRIERVLIPDDGPDGQAPTASATPDRRFPD